MVAGRLNGLSHRSPRQSDLCVRAVCSRMWSPIHAGPASVLPAASMPPTCGQTKQHYQNVNLYSMARRLRLSDMSVVAGRRAGSI